MAFVRFVLLCAVAPLAAAMHRYGNESIELHHVPGKYIFVAGLEGSGHHFFQLVFEKCLEIGSCGNRSREFYRWAWGASKRHDQVAMRRVWGVEDPRPDAGVELFAPLQDKVYPLNAVAVAGQMMSYPNFLPGNDPNMVEFYHAAKYHGDSLKVVVLVRNPRDLLHSVQRRFNHTEDDLVASLKTLTTQLKKMPRSSYKCLRFEKLGSVGPTFQKYLDIPDFDVTGAMSELFEEEPGCASANITCPEAAKLKKFHAKFMKDVCATATDEKSGAMFLRIDGTELLPAHDIEAVSWLLT